MKECNGLYRDKGWTKTSDRPSYGIDIKAQRSVVEDKRVLNVNPKEDKIWMADKLDPIPIHGEMGVGGEMGS